MPEKPTFRLFEPSDADTVAAVVAKTMRTSNAVDYSSDYIEADLARLTASYFLEKAQATHFYVIELADQIIGTGAIGPYWDVAGEASLFSIFILPEYQHQGFGRLLIDTLEQDDYFKQAHRIEIPASITGRPFYEAMGYQIKGNQSEPDAEQLYRLEKFHTPET
ncbi:GNAT family N-acetyltransferase [Weissella minor]|uniref:GNAT family N-acetyltransferase n=1 Tax=Weissella minor TaxID=1620 RepID=UPI001BAEA7AC|nr:GNAT family N-acetyltransferase [Weissella minor]MBS0950071.1 GNAT family N-acetyltransferase [Weissella minor]